MKRKALLLLSVICTLSFAWSTSAQTSFGRSSLFNDGWTFVRADMAGASAPDFDDSGWTPVQLPYDWSVKGVLSPDNASCTGFLPAGIGWYRKHFSGRRLPAGRSEEHTSELQSRE